MTDDTEPTPATPVAEPDASVLAGGLLVVVFGLAAVMTAIGTGWAGTAVLGVVLLVLAWRVPISRSARVLPLLIAGFGVVSLVGALVLLLG